MLVCRACNRESSVRSGCYPFLLRHGPIGNDVVSMVGLNVLHVTPLAGSAILEPEALCSNVARKRIAIQAFDYPFVACIAPAF